MYVVIFSATFKKQYRKLPKNLQDRVRECLHNLQEDPKKPRVGMDIKKVADTKPIKHRVRVGQYRIIYCVKDDIVKIIEIFKRGRGY